MQLTYSLHALLPTLAIVESAEAPPEYEFVSANDIPDGNAHDLDGDAPKGSPTVPDMSANGQASSNQAPDETAGVPARPAGPVTSDFRATLRLLRAAGHDSYRHGLSLGFKWAFFVNVAQLLISAVLVSMPYLPTFVMSTVVSLATTHLVTAWVHAVVSKQRDADVWQQLPSYLLIFKATAVPVIAKAAVLQLIRGFLHLLLGERSGSADPMGIIPTYDGGFWLHVTVLGVVVAAYVCAYIPIEVILTRTRASSMPSPSFDTDSIPPRRHSFISCRT